MAMLVRGNFIRYVRTILSAVFAVVYLLAVGFIDLRAEAMTRGGVLGLNNDLVSVAPPASPWMLNVAMACLSGLLVFWLLRRPGNHKHTSVYPAGAALLVLTTCAVSFSATKDYSVSVQSLYQPNESPASAVFLWAQAGALSPAVHAIMAVLVVVVAMALNRNRTTQHFTHGH